jgi:hypothetical protein
VITTLKLLFRQILHNLIIISWLAKPSTSSTDYLGQAFLSASSRWNGELDPILTYISFTSYLCNASFKGKFLELGGGYSTVIFNHYFAKLQIELLSIDAYPVKYNRILNSFHSSRLFLDSIDCRYQLTVNYQQAVDGVSNLISELSKFTVTSLQRSLSKFVLDPSAIDLIIQKIHYQSFADELISHINSVSERPIYSLCSGPSFLSELSSKSSITKPKFDAIFFDCGELSSMAEWMYFRGLIPVGGYALFHDIFYPKSIKNFLVATYIDLSPLWNIVFLDRLTPQGGMIAMRISHDQDS